MQALLRYQDSKHRPRDERLGGVGVGPMGSRGCDGQEPAKPPIVPGAGNAGIILSRFLRCKGCFANGPGYWEASGPTPPLTKNWLQGIGRPSRGQPFTAYGKKQDIQGGVRYLTLNS